MHSASLAHGGVHAGNVLLVPEQAANGSAEPHHRGATAKLQFLGFSHIPGGSLQDRLQDRGQQRARSGAQCAHIAPELLSAAPAGSSHKATAAGDVYAMGILIWWVPELAWLRASNQHTCPNHPLLCSSGVSMCWCMLPLQAALHRQGPL
jgi:hypothetical protein